MLMYSKNDINTTDGQNNNKRDSSSYSNIHYTNNNNTNNGKNKFKTDRMGSLSNDGKRDSFSISGVISNKSG